MYSTGYGQHGDYVFGWQEGVLQKAMDAGCFGASCKALKTQAFTAANKCAVPDTVKESIEGCKLCFNSFSNLFIIRNILMWIFL